MKDKQEFLEAMDLQKDEEGHWFVNGNVWGNVGGTVFGSVGGTVEGNVWGNVKGSVRGDVEGTVFGSVDGNVWGNVKGNVDGSVWGDVDGNVRGHVMGNVEGSVEGSIKGRKWQFAEENERLREDCKFLLSFAPKDAVPELDPTFYRTGTYGGDLQLQQRIDGIKAALEENNDD